ncbi:MAG TPA: heparan-alpha-glucosaminide N-acetyltransferase domain-containing protein [Clostridiales bacterium]|nr:heparan-alpha-glucosaminide N-acetyltransferase domain-containing protein [Clostridiales bacterium]HRT82266.1 heparan-alpha-glucosaminide N-acetyltransferase domain-containing protein [Oscillospiraceae bacterium]
MQETKIKRIVLLDEIRGFSLVCMILYHTFFLMSKIFKLEVGNFLFGFFRPLQPLISTLFILVSGISARLSRSNLKRGLRLFGVAMGFSLVTIFVLPLIGLEDLGIYFGILHFLSVSMLIFAGAQKLLDKLPPHWGLLVCFVLYFFTANIGKGYLGFSPSTALHLPKALYESKFLFPLGIYGPSFHSADYFPLFPRIFMFLAATYLGLALLKADLPASVYKRHIKVFELLGKNSLLVYILHVPLIYVIIYAALWVSQFFGG